MTRSAEATNTALAKVARKAGTATAEAEKGEAARSKRRARAEGQRARDRKVRAARDTAEAERAGDSARNEQQAELRAALPSGYTLLASQTYPYAIGYPEGWSARRHGYSYNGRGYDLFFTQGRGVGMVTMTIAAEPLHPACS